MHSAKNDASAAHLFTSLFNSRNRTAADILRTVMQNAGGFCSAKRRVFRRAKERND
jgi:hypothetical protein